MGRENRPWTKGLKEITKASFILDVKLLHEPGFPSINHSLTQPLYFGLYGHTIFGLGRST